MEPIRSRTDPCVAVDVSPGQVAASVLPKRDQDGKIPARDKTRLCGLEARADAIGRAAPFTDWPRDVLLRLAAASSAASHPSETSLIANGQRCDHITVIAEGTVLSSVSTPGGRRLTYKIDDAAFAYGLASLADGLPLQVDLVADGPVAVVRTPLAAVRAELTRLPALWESIAVETIRRSRRYATQLNQFVLDTPRVRAASLLIGLLAKSGKDGIDGAVDIGFRLSQERLADMLGVSRQWATAVVRELAQAGLIEWHYGRVTVLDVQGLRRLASSGIDAPGERSEQVAAHWRVDAGTTRAAAASPIGRGARRRTK
jgi:CRP/FNR family cyclic AMP-dependent transcriptional regulator